MILRNKLFIAGITIYVFVIILGFSYPQNRPFGELVFENIGLPVHSNPDRASGLNYNGLTIIFLFLISLILLNHSLAKHHVKIITGAVLFPILVPMLLIGAYQRTIANGVDAISYEKDYSECHYELSEDEKTLHGECFVPLKNMSNEDVHFSLQFNKEPYDEVLMNSLMNREGSYTYLLHSKENKILHIKADIDTSQLNEGEYPSDGSSYHFDITLKDDEKERRF